MTYNLAAMIADGMHLCFIDKYIDQRTEYA